jgi:flavin reductase (DIM6/NTAB) family NADH-FMN oxidoreductase RutF
MAVIDPAALSPVARYRLLINTVVPRPIAWVSTVDTEGHHNLAPFSFFNGVTARPPTVMISIGAREPIKDTLANLRATGEAVVHLPPPELLEAVHQSGAEYRHGVSEAEQLGLELVASERVRPPRLAAAQVAFECRLVQEVAIGDPATAVCFLEVLLAHVADEVLAEDGLPDPGRMRSCARLGNRAYLSGQHWDLVELPAQAVPEGLGVERRRSGR